MDSNSKSNKPAEQYQYNGPYPQQRQHRDGLGCKLCIRSRTQRGMQKKRLTRKTEIIFAQKKENKNYSSKKRKSKITVSKKRKTEITRLSFYFWAITRLSLGTRKQGAYFGSAQCFITGPSCFFFITGPCFPSGSIAQFVLFIVWSLT